MADLNEQQAWVLDWIKNNFEASCLTSDFHQAFHEKYPKYKRIWQKWGCSPVPQAMRIISQLYKKGLLNRRKISLGGNWQPGFPKFVRSYQAIQPETPACQTSGTNGSS